MPVVSRRYIIKKQSSGSEESRRFSDTFGVSDVGWLEALVVDYVDEMIPAPARMAAKRRMGYRALGDTVE